MLGSPTTPKTGGDDNCGSESETDAATFLPTRGGPDSCMLVYAHVGGTVPGYMVKALAMHSLCAHGQSV